MLTWGDFEKLLQLEMDEAELPENAVSAVNSALRHLASHWAHGAIYDATVTNSGALLLPENYLEMHGVRAVDDGIVMKTYTQFPDDDDGGIGWYEFPYGTLQFPFYRGKVQVFYYAYYPPIKNKEDKNQVMPIPMWSIKALLILSSAYIQFPNVHSDATLNQFNTRLDSGNPEDIPLIIAIKFLRTQYEAEVATWPKQKRGLMYEDTMRNLPARR